MAGDNAMLVAGQMRLLRRQLSWMLASWLLFQLVGITAPVVLGAVGIVEDACTCPGTKEGATCPMHHGTNTTKYKVNPCVLTSAAPPTEIALLGLAGGSGVLPNLIAFDVVDRPFARVSIALASPLSRTDLPDSPPPRG
jgi:hypothetical protein